MLYLYKHCYICICIHIYTIAIFIYINIDIYIHIYTHFKNLNNFLPVVFINKELAGRLLHLKFGFIHHDDLNQNKQKISLQKS